MAKFLKDLISFTDTEYEVCKQILKNKSKDYGRDENCLKNFTLCEFVGVTSVKEGIFVRILDKIQRIANGIKKGEFAVKDEKMEDTIRDTINYLSILHFYIARENIRQNKVK